VFPLLGAVLDPVKVPVLAAGEIGTVAKAIMLNASHKPL
jgi:hypothetical protein